MEKIELKGGTLLAPVPPVMVTCGDIERSNIITVAWCGILNTVPPVTYVSIRPERYSYGIIKTCGEFIINLTPAALIKTADYCGMRTGRKVDKFAECGLTKEMTGNSRCPAIAESPLNIECKVREIVPLGSHDMFIADIISVRAAETLIDEKGKLRIEKAGLAAYAHGDYYELGKKIGYFGFSAVKKSKRK